MRFRSINTGFFEILAFHLLVKRALPENPHE